MRLTGLAILLLLTACAAPVQSYAPPSLSPASTGGISRDEALDAARDALREAGEDWDVVLTEAGPLERVMPGWQDSEWGRDLSGDLSVWRVVMAAGDLTGEVVIDSRDGSVYGTVIGVAN